MTDIDNKYADGFPFSREGEDFKQGLSLMREVLGQHCWITLCLVMSWAMFFLKHGELYMSEKV